MKVQLSAMRGQGARFTSVVVTTYLTTTRLVPCIWPVILIRFLCSVIYTMVYQQQGQASEQSLRLMGGGGGKGLKGRGQEGKKEINNSERRNMYWLVTL